MSKISAKAERSPEESTPRADCTSCSLTPTVRRRPQKSTSWLIVWTAARTSLLDPKIHDHALGIQKHVLDHVMHPVVTKRLTDTRLYGNEYAVSQMVTELTAAIFEADMSEDVNGFRQNLQAEYVGRLIAVVAPDSGYDQPTRAIALYTLQDLQRRLGAKTAGDLGTRAHTAALLHTIDKALETS